MSIGHLEERVPQLAWTKYFTTIMMDRYSLHTQVATGVEPETHMKRQATRHDCLPIFLGYGDK
jgi:hypothetical protein